MKPLIAAGAGLAGLALWVPASGADLLQFLREARANDAQYASARAALDAGREKLPQGRALLFPTITGSANSVWNDGEVRLRSAAPGPFPRQFNSNGWSLNLTQPVLRLQNWEQFKQSEFQVAQAEAQFAQASQDLILRVSQAYFDVLASQDSLAFILAQKAAISEQLAQAKRNFEVGTATITDTNEAQARFDLSTSQEIAARNDLEIRKQALQLSIGKYPDALTPMRGKVQISAPQPAAMEQWVDSAQSNNFAVRIQEAALEIANREIRRSRAGHLPTLDLVTSYSETGAQSNLNTGVGSDFRGATIGLQLNLPIYAGGGVDSRVREAIANREKARFDLENSRRQAALSARQA